MQTVTVDIINEKALSLLKNLEGLKLIRIRKKSVEQKESLNLISKYKGAMQKQPLEDIDNQLNELRQSWE
jgi:hypothetical protein